MPVPHCMFSAGRCVFWCLLAGAESISAGEMAGGRVSFSDTTGYLPKSGYSSEKK